MSNIEHFVAPYNDQKISIDAVDITGNSGSFFAEAWKNLKSNPMFYVSSALVVIFILVGIFPSVFSDIDPDYCDITKPRLPIGADGHILGTTLQGCDIYSRLVFGASSSLQVGVLVTLIGTLFGIIWGTISGYCGGIIDSIMSRILEVFMSIPGILAFMVVLQLMREIEGAIKLIVVFSIFGWMTIARLTRGNIIAAKSQEFITSSIALGQSKFQIMLKHALPNSLGPVIATATMSVGTWIIVEASMSFLGIGLGGGQISWGSDISTAASNIVTWSQAPHILFFPSLMLAICSLTFIFLGDALHSAIDPKERR